MIIKPARLRPIPSFLLPFTKATVSSSSTQSRGLHHHMTYPRIPRPTPFVPDTQTFLTLIGRSLSQHASKFPSWQSLFALTTSQLKELGIEPPRSRRYLLRWREKFRKGQYGIGGDLQHVENGTAFLKVVEVPANAGWGAAAATATVSQGNRKMVVNVPDGRGSALDSNISARRLVPVKGLRIQGAHTIVGPYVQPLIGGKTAKIVVQEGLWEDRRGRKIDGGERRQAEVRAKRRAEEKRVSR